MIFLFLFSLWSFGIPQIRRDIQNLSDSPVCTQLWPLWVNLIICVCQPVRVLSLRSTVSSQPPLRFFTRFPRRDPCPRRRCRRRAETGHKPIFNQVAAVAFAHGGNKKSQKPEQMDTVSSPRPDFHLKFLTYREKINKKMLVASNLTDEILNFNFWIYSYRNVVTRTQTLTSGFMLYLNFAILRLL